MSSQLPRGRSVSVAGDISGLNESSSQQTNLNTLSQHPNKVSPTNRRHRRLSSVLHLNLPTASLIGGSNIHESGIKSAAITPEKRSLSGSIASQLQFLHLPTFSLTTSPSCDDDGSTDPEQCHNNNNNNYKRFIFGLGLRRHSNVTLHRSESMVSLCFRSIANFIADNNLQALQTFLENKQVQIDDRDENGTTALMVAATKGRTQFVRELLAHGADANAEDSDGWTSLKCAAKEGHADICSLLIQHNAQLEHRDSGGWTALMWASYKGRVEAVQVLVESGADVNAHGNYHISSLLWASGRGYTRIVQILLSNGAKVNVGDKYGTTALVWACRKGYYEIVDSLLRSGANVDTAGMYSWTPLLVASMGNYCDIVNRLLEHKPNVNALDKDGCTALTIACKEGFHEIVIALLNAGAYINIQDRVGDTNLIHAVKGNHRSVVEALLKKYADVDTPGKDRKTAIYNAVEKGNVQIVKILLNANPDLEIATKDGDTPLLRAVRTRNAEIVQLLLDKKAKVSAADRKGDTALHIAMRARSKAIVEILLRNPKHSQLLYRPNRQGETPYNIDLGHQKTILGQIFGARRLNTNEDNENMLGYDLYSSALADILSEPSLSMPITVGLYAKWGSGKSFLLNKLRDEMKNFAKQWIEPSFQFSFVLFLIVIHVALIIGAVLSVLTQDWAIAVGSSIGFIVFVHFLLGVVQYLSQKYDWDWPYNFNVALTRKLNSLKLVLQIMFCHPPGIQNNDSLTAQPIRFYFTDQTRISSTTSGENSVVQMIGSLYEAIESDYGTMSTRLYRAFRPKPVKENSPWRWRKLCCLPYVALFEISFINFLFGACILTMYILKMSDRITLQIILITIALLLGTAIVANLYTWSRMLRALMFSQRRHLQRSISNLETLKSEGFLQVLRSEVTLMTDMIKCLDRLTAQQTRLVIIVDGLDSCEQDKVLLVLDAVHMLFSDANSPFIIILAIDPHAISKAVEVNSRRLFSESNIGGHDYLRNMVHLPFYLQNSGLRRVKIAQHTAQTYRRTTISGGGGGNIEDSNAAPGPSTTLGRSVSSRRLSSESGLMSSCEKLKPPPPRKGSRKLKLSESIASSIGSNLNRIGGANDLTKMLLTDDYFSDVNPRSMRRLMNVVYITGRLLKAFQIDFNWYHLASWINITEQWPYKTSWIILYHEMHEEDLDDSAPIKTLYDKIRPRIPTSKEVEPLLELDRDERKFDIFLTFHRSSLLISDLKIFLPFTINLDPYVKKVIKEEQQSLDDGGIILNPTPGKHFNNTGSNWNHQPLQMWSPNVKNPTQKRPISYTNQIPNHELMYQNNVQIQQNPALWNIQNIVSPYQHSLIRRVPSLTNLSKEVLKTKLSRLSVDGVCDLLNKIDDINVASRPKYCQIIRDNNINGRVLMHCDLDELKKVLSMNFGDWELFRMLIVYLREKDLNLYSSNVGGEDEFDSSTEMKTSVSGPVVTTGGTSGHHSRHSGERSSSITSGGGNPTSGRSSVRSNSSVSGHIDKTNAGQNESNSNSLTSSTLQRSNSGKQSTVEKQVSLEEQMICGALQTLNEEACEDVLGGDHSSTSSSQCDEESPILAATSITAINVPPVIITDSSPIGANFKSLELVPNKRYSDYYEQNELSSSTAGYNRFIETSSEASGNMFTNISSQQNKLKNMTLASSLEKLVTIKDTFLRNTTASSKHFDMSHSISNDDDITDENTPLVLNVDHAQISGQSSASVSFSSNQDLPDYQVLSPLSTQNPQFDTSPQENSNTKVTTDVQINLWDDPETTV